MCLSLQRSRFDEPRILITAENEIPHHGIVIIGGIVSGNKPVDA